MKRNNDIIEAHIQIQILITDTWPSESCMGSVWNPCCPHTHKSQYQNQLFTCNYLSNPQPHSDIIYVVCNSELNFMPMTWISSIFDVAPAITLLTASLVGFPFPNFQHSTSRCPFQIKIFSIMLKKENIYPFPILNSSFLKRWTISWSLYHIWLALFHYAGWHIIESWNKGLY